VEESRFDTLVRMVAHAASRRTLISAFTGLVLSRDIVSSEPATAGRRRSRHHQHHHRHKGETHGEACIPTGQRCPSKKPRGKRGKKLGCNSCCQGTFTTDASGKKVCGCQPNGAACTSAAASSCCSGYCNGTTCQIPPSAPCSPRTCAGCCDSAGACQAGTNPTACGSGGTTCAVCAGSSPLCSAHVCVACANHAACGTNELCVDGACHPCDVTAGQDLAAAVAAAADGDTLYICAGTYAGGITIGRNITLIGAGQDADGAVIEGGSPVLTILAGTESEPVGLRNLRIQDGTGPGIHLPSPRHLTITDCNVSGNDAAVGGGVFIQGGALLMTRCTVEDNQVSIQGGGLFNNNGQTTLIDCHIQSNFALFGGGISTVGGALTLRGTRVSGNFASSGSGIANLTPAVPVTFENGSVVCANNPTTDQCAGFTPTPSACQDTCPPV
jgi:hypothetical protein